MKKNKKKLAVVFLTIVLLLATCTIPARACSGSLNLLLGNDTGWQIQNIHIWKDGEPDLISDETLQGGEGKWISITVVPGELYHFSGHNNEDNIDFVLDFYPLEQDGLVDIMYPDSNYVEGGGAISATTSTISVSRSPSSGGTTSGSGTVNCGSIVTVIATPATGYTFVNWTESSVPMANTASYSFPVVASRTLMANFAPIPYTILTSSSPSDGGTTSGGGTKNYGLSMTVRATPAAGYTFANWTEGGTVVSTIANYTFTVNGNRTLVANFLPTVSISANLANAWEASEDPAVFIITRSASSSVNALTVNLTISGTATAGVDYPAINPQIIIPAGAASAAVYVWPNQENISETVKTVCLTLQNSNSYITGSPAIATVYIHDDAAPITDPKVAGPYSFYQITYNGGTRDLSPWGMSATYPVTGIVDIPVGAGPFPLVILHHGGGFSPEGYLYLCDLLASQGIIAATIDDNSQNIPAGLLLLEHIRYIATQYNGDINHVMLIGHSYGGEAALFASYLNKYPSNVASFEDPQGFVGPPLDGSHGLGPYHFDLKGIIGLAPQDADNLGGVNDNFLALCGTRDDFDDHRQRYYDGAQPIDPANPAAAANGFKASVQVYGAVHSYLSTDDFGVDTTASMTQEQEEIFAKVYVGAMARVVLLEQPQYLKFLRDYRFAASCLPANMLSVSQFQPPTRLWIDNYEEDADPATLSPPLAGLGFNSWNVATSGDFSEYTSGGYYSLEAGSIPYHSFHQVRFHWSNVNNYYKVSFSGSGLNSAGYSYLALRIGQSTENSPSGSDKHVKIIVQDIFGHSASFPVALSYPDMGSGKHQLAPMQTIKISLNGLGTAGLDMNHLAFIKLTPDLWPSDSVTGTVYFDDIQLMN